MKTQSDRAGSRETITKALNEFIDSVEKAIRQKDCLDTVCRKNQKHSNVFAHLEQAARDELDRWRELVIERGQTLAAIFDSRGIQSVAVKAVLNAFLYSWGNPEEKIDKDWYSRRAQIEADAASKPEPAAVAAGKKRKPLTVDEQIIFDAIPVLPGTIAGKAIVERVATKLPGVDEARVSRICTKTLKAYGVKNRRGAGYYRTA